MYRLFAVASTLIAITCASVAAAAIGATNLVKNGTFETTVPVRQWRELPAGARDIPGWTVAASDVDIVGRYWQASGGGANSLELDGVPAGAIEQQIATQPGHAYRLAFMLAGNPDGPPKRKLLRVTAGSVEQTLEFDVTATSRAAMGYVARTLDFRATAPASIIRFANAEGRHFWGPVIDDVSVTEIAGSASPAPVPPVLATPVPATPVAATPMPAPATSAVTWHSPTSFGGDWIAYYPKAPISVHVVENGSSVVARPRSGALFAHDQVLWYGAKRGARFVVTDHCADPGAQGWHGGVIERTSPTSFTLTTADCVTHITRYVRR
ncbi:MAG: hypothetical protein NVS2B17_08970 [Candidatus Velthaea sp.]